MYGLYNTAMLWRFKKVWIEMVTKTISQGFGWIGGHAIDDYRSLMRQGV